MAVLAIVLLIIAFILAFIGLILSIVGVCKRKRTKVLAIIGLVFSVLVLVLFFVLISGFGWVLSQI